MKWLRGPCFHTTVYVWRCHKDVVPQGERDKVLYIDRLGVWNFVRCRNCGKFINTDQNERLYEQEETK